MINNGKKIRLVDIAEKVGVTPAVVSLVLNHRQSLRQHVSPEKRDAILRISKELNYCPDVSARALQGKRTNMIGVLIDTEAPSPMFNLVETLEAEAASRNLRILVGEAHNNIKRFYDTYQQLRQHGVDGIICISHDYPWMNDQVEYYFSNSPTTVFIGEPFIPGCAHIIPNLETGMKEAMAHLREKGYTSTAFLTMTDDYRTKDLLMREKAYIDACNGDISLLMKVITQNQDSKTLQRDLKKAIMPALDSRKIDSIIAINDTIALAIQGILQQAGYRVPQDIALIGHDNDPFSKFMLPSLTTIDENLVPAAHHAIIILTDLIEGKPTPPPVIVPSRLIVRDSSVKN